MVLANPPPTPWPRELHYLRGSPDRLSGLEVYHDFDWLEVFGHSRKQFPHGQKLTELIRRDCPTGKSPALLLTTREDGIASPIRTASHYIVVVKVREYLLDSTADPAYTFFARGAKGPITGISALQNLVVTPEVLDAFLGTHLDIEALIRWAQGNQERLEQLAGVAGPPIASDVEPGNVQDVIRTLESLNRIDGPLLEALASCLSSSTDKASRLNLLHALVCDGEGESSKLNEAVGELFATMEKRGVTAATLAGLLANRNLDLLRTVAISAKLVEYRRALDGLKSMMSAAVALEDDYQKLLRANPWLFGSEYSELVDRRRWTRDDNLDFMLRRTADGYLEIVEIKTPIPQPLLNHDSSHDSYYPAAPLSQVLGQVIRYIEQIERHRDSICSQDQEDPLKIRARIIIGRDGDAKQQAALRKFNSHLHGIDILTFDQLVRIGERVIGVFQTGPADDNAQLVVPSEEAPSSAAPAPP